jgi:hypothetical protein
MSRDLWPNEFDTGSVVAPVTILKEQAAYLGPKTNNLVEGRVLSGNESPNFIHRLFLVAPALDDYVYLLLKLSNPIEMYPANITFMPTSETIMVESPEQLLNSLESLFKHDKTKSVIRTLIAQSQK